MYFKFASSEQHNNTQLESAMINSDYVLLMTDFINRNTIVKRFKAKLINVNGGITNLEDTITKLLNKNDLLAVLLGGLKLLKIFDLN